MYKVVSFLLPEGPAMDMWGLGSVMAELLAGETVPGGDTAGDDWCGVRVEAGCEVLAGVLAGFDMS